jgi:hypothetical protein
LFAAVVSYASSIRFDVSYSRICPVISDVCPFRVTP